MNRKMRRAGKIQPWLVMAAALVSSAQTPLVFSRDIAPLIQTNCAPCHHTGGIGPFPLMSYADIHKHARQIVEVTRSRYMPPWLPAPGFGEFEDEKRLTSGQIKLFANWVQQGMPNPDPQLELTGQSVWTLGKPDAIVQASAPLDVPATGGDIYWNFVLAPHLNRSRYVRAMEIRPSNPKLIHHANIILDRIGSIQQSSPGMDIVVPRNPLDFDGHFLFFKPGQTSFAEPAGFSWRLDPGANLILNTHIQPSGKPEVEQPTIALYFTDQAPVHFPYLLQLENDNALNIPAGDADFVVSDGFKLPVDTQVLAIYPHAHYLGKLLESYATLPDGTRKWLIRIPNWDPNWQAVYRYRTPVTLPAGTMIAMRYHYDNSAANPRNPNKPPRRVQAGDRAADEMAHLWLQVMPQSPRESRRVYAEAWAEHQLKKSPRNFAANLTMGSLALARFDAAAAVEPLQRAVQIRPGDSIAHNLYGSALMRAGRNAEAVAEFQAAVTLNPTSANARLNLARALVQAGKGDEALRNLETILQAYPNDPAATDLIRQLGRRPPFQ